MVNDAGNTDSILDTRKKVKRKPPPAWPPAHAHNVGAALLIQPAVWQDCCLSAGYTPRPLLRSLPLFIALYLCPPVWRWCHSWGEAMIKILLSPSQHGPALRRDSVPPVRARRVVAAHSSRCLHSTGGRRVDCALPAKAEILDICLSEEEIKKSSLSPGSPWHFPLPLCCDWGF